MLTIVELPSYLKAVTDILSNDEREQLKSFLAANPLAGDLIQGTGGVRKVRWSASNRGKSGGARVIYFFYNQSIPLFMLAAYKKKDKSNLTPAERNQLLKLVNKLVESYE